MEEQQHQRQPEEQHLEPNTDENQELQTLEEDVKLMAEKIADFRQTLPQQLKETLASIISAHRPATMTSAYDDSDPGPSSNSNLDVSTSLDSEDPMHTENVQTIKQKVSSNASTMPLLVKRMEVCISRIAKLDSFKHDPIHPAFTRTRPT